VLEALAYGMLAKEGSEASAEAINYLTRAIRRGSTSPTDFEQCGSLLIQAGRLGEAAVVLQQGIKVIPHDGELHRLLGVCYLSQNKPVEAKDILTRAVQMFPENKAIRVLLVEAHKAVSEN
jgi:Flp pilus assembly protein TadD